MPYDEKLAERVRLVLKGLRAQEKRMFGGLTFMLGGHMCCGIVEDTLMVRVGPAAYERSLAKPHAREMDFTGRSLRGYVYVAPAGLKTARSLRAWVERGVDFVRTLPPKR